MTEQVVSVKRRLIIQDRVRLEWEWQRVDIEWVCRQAENADFDVQDDKRGYMRLLLPDSRYILLRGTKQDDRFILDDYHIMEGVPRV